MKTPILKLGSVQHYDANAKTFAQPVNQKVKILLECGLISKVTDGIYSAAPIPGYNITRYTIREHFGRLLCNCQKGRKGGDCSHTQAVRIYQCQVEHTKEQQLHML